jgi:putative membrane protein insertion efficiency factor
MKRLISKFDFLIKQNDKPILARKSLCRTIFGTPSRQCGIFLFRVCNIFYKAIFKITLLSLRLYKLLISPFLGSCCRFYPSCSDYAYESFSKHGLLLGAWLTLKRLCRCHPFGSGGIDWVPDKTPETVQRYCQSLRKTVTAQHAGEARTKISTATRQNKADAVLPKF